MKVTDLRPCDNCGGPIAPSFYIVRMTMAFIKPAAIDEFMGMHKFFGGRASPALVENFAPAAADAVIVAGDKEPSLMTEAFVCAKCYIDRDLDLPMLQERVQARHRRAEEAKA